MITNVAVVEAYSVALVPAVMIGDGDQQVADLIVWDVAWISVVPIVAVQSTGLGGITEFD